jgi:hypothetical protein
MFLTYGSGEECQRRCDQLTIVMVSVTVSVILLIGYNLCNIVKVRVYAVSVK